MNELKILAQMIKNGDLGGISSNSTSYIAYADHESIFHDIDNRNNGDSAINITSFTYGQEGKSVYDIINTNFVDKDASELWESTIIVVPGVDVENGSRPIVLSHFTYDSENYCFFCDFDFFGKSLYWHNDEGYAFTGTIKGIACISYTSQSEGTPSTLNFNTCTLDASYGVLSYTFTYNHVE